MSGSSGPPVVERPSLYDRLDAASGVTLVSAPAGSGKTMLLRAWLADERRVERNGWVTVERDERDAQRFWHALVDALRAACGADAGPDPLEPRPSFDGQAMVERLVTELGAFEHRLVLVVDDVHELRSPEALSQLEQFLARRPPELRVVLASRHDPRLGLHRLRLAGELTEIRASDLRFDLAETHALLDATGVRLSDTAVSLAFERTEGWAAGLRLLALSLPGQSDPDAFVAAFSGSERTVAEYLLAEVLEQQPQPVRHLLLRSSIADRVNGALADALTEAPGSEAILRTLDASNAFVNAVDPARTWFRIHALFADLLRLELHRTEPEQVRRLHAVAAAWHAANGYPIEAVRHAQSAGDWQLACRLLADHAHSLTLDGRGETLGVLLAALPPGLDAEQPELARVLASHAAWFGSTEDAARQLASAERGSEAVPAASRRRHVVLLALTRMMLARRQGDLEAIRREARSLVEPLDERPLGDSALDDDVRAVALLSVGATEAWTTPGVDAERRLTEALAIARRRRRTYLECQCLGHLAAAGADRSWRDVRARAVEALERAESSGLELDPVAGFPAAIVGSFDALQGRFDEAEHLLGRARRTLAGELEPAVHVMLHVGTGMLRSARGDDRGALGEFREAVRRQRSLVGRHVLTTGVRRLLAETQVRLGDAAGARATLAELSEADRDAAPARTARACLAIHEGEPQAALDLLAPILDRSLAALHLLLVQAHLFAALARDALGDDRGAESEVEHALAYAEPEGLLWPFVVTPVQPLLERHPRHRTAHASLLADALDLLGGGAPRTRDAPVAPLRDELSDGELRVLRFLPGNLSAPEIASELYLSANTVKTHMRHIYAKLGVHRRTDAVERARALGLLSPLARRR